MMPDNVLSSSPISGAFLVPDKVEPLVDYEWGGVALLDTSKGLMVYVWKCFYQDGWIKVTNDIVTHQVIQVANVKHLSLAFDFNMRPTIAYIVENVDKTRDTYLYWYDSQVPGQVNTLYGLGYVSPQLSLDDHRLRQSANADIIFAYIRNNNLYHRQQRDRFTTEYFHYAGIADAVELKQIGMNVANRFQFLFQSPNYLDANIASKFMQERSVFRLLSETGNFILLEQ